ncbi:hypothetical protein, partial [Escherichia coli]|uniref:hypothetical protein n=1 Tax=Escherichia coli TaxID=562 RepID=UPI001BCEECE5
TEEKKKKRIVVGDRGRRKEEGTNVQKEDESEPLSSRNAKRKKGIVWRYRRGKKKEKEGIGKKVKEAGFLNGRKEREKEKGKGVPMIMRRGEREREGNGREKERR